MLTVQGYADSAIRAANTRPLYVRMGAFLLLPNADFMLPTLSARLNCALTSPANYPKGT